VDIAMREGRIIMEHEQLGPARSFLDLGREARFFLCFEDLRRTSR